MKKLLFFSLLVCFVSSFGVQAYGHFRIVPIGLTELCPNAEFEYKGLKINSFKEIEGYQYLPRISVYALEDIVDYHGLFSDDDADQLETIKKNYHQSLKEMYSPSYMNDPIHKDMPKRLSEIQKSFTSFLGKGVEYRFRADAVLKKQSLKVEKAKNLSLALNAHKNNQPLFEGALGYHELLEPFSFWLNWMRSTYKDHLSIAFPDEEAVDVFMKEIYKFDGFEPLYN